MLTDIDLRELLSYKSESPVMSVYLNTEPEEGNADAHKLHLRSMLKEINLPDDVTAVLRYFDHEHSWTGRSVIVFSCIPDNFFQAFTLAVPVRSRVRVNDHPHVKPLADLFDSYGGYGVALVDKQGARLFSFHLGELREQEGVLGENVRHTKRGGGSSYPGRKGGVAGKTEDASEITERNMRDEVNAATVFFTENNVRRLLIGGSDENIAQFKGLLPKTWQSLVVGSFNIAMSAGEHEVLEKAMQVGSQAEIQREAALAEKVITEALKGKAGVLGLDDTLDAVQQGRVQVLLIREGYRAPGYISQGCGFITTQSLQVCPFCGDGLVLISDAVEMAVHQVMRSGGDVEVLQTDQLFGERENIGALLRF